MNFSCSTFNRFYEHSSIGNNARSNSLINLFDRYVNKDCLEKNFSAHKNFINMTPPQQNPLLARVKIQNHDTKMQEKQQKTLSAKKTVRKLVCRIENKVLNKAGLYGPIRSLKGSCAVSFSSSDDDSEVFLAAESLVENSIDMNDL